MEMVGNRSLNKKHVSLWMPPKGQPHHRANLSGKRTEQAGNSGKPGKVGQLPDFASTEGANPNRGESLRFVTEDASNSFYCCASSFYCIWH